MRVCCDNLDDFITNLKHEPASNVVRHVVHVSTTMRPLDTSDKRTAVKFSVVFQASVVVNLDDGGQYMLDYGEDCGLDYRDASKDFKGSERAAALRKRLEEFCDDHGLTIRPGVVES